MEPAAGEVRLEEVLGSEPKLTEDKALGGEITVLAGTIYDL